MDLPRSAQLRLTGNGVVPEQAAYAFRLLELAHVGHTKHAGGDMALRGAEVLDPEGFVSAQGPVRAAANTRDDWETPPELFRRLHDEFDFTLDAAASPENAKCGKFLSGPCHACDPTAPTQSRALCRCGHCSPWSGTVWLNPPYGKGLGVWIDKAASEALRNLATTVMLLPANSDTAWFRRLWEVASEIRFLSGRVQFVGTTSSNTGGSVIAVIKPHLGLYGGPAVFLWDWRSS